MHQLSHARSTIKAGKFVKVYSAYHISKLSSMSHLETCTFNKELNGANIHKLEGCTRIKGSITIHSTAFSGDYNFDDPSWLFNWRTQFWFKFAILCSIPSGPIRALTGADFEKLSSITYISDYLFVQQVPDLPFTRSFSYFRNLVMIAGHKYYPYEIRWVFFQFSIQSMQSFHMF